MKFNNHTATKGSKKNSVPGHIRINCITPWFSQMPWRIPGKALREEKVTAPTLQVTLPPQELLSCHIPIFILNYHAELY